MGLYYKMSWSSHSAALLYLLSNFASVFKATTVLWRHPMAQKWSSTCWDKKKKKKKKSTSFPSELYKVQINNKTDEISTVVIYFMLKPKHRSIKTPRKRKSNKYSKRRKYTRFNVKTSQHFTDRLENFLVLIKYGTDQRQIRYIHRLSSLIHNLWSMFRRQKTSCNPCTAVISH